MVVHAKVDIDAAHVRGAGVDNDDPHLAIGQDARGLGRLGTGPAGEQQQHGDRPKVPHGALVTKCTATFAFASNPTSPHDAAMAFSISASVSPAIFALMT